MCGIAGWFTLDKSTKDTKQQLLSMARAIMHRGPDGTGIWSSEHAHFAHTRLAIIDLASGTQPMSSACGRATITFNGEIYNFRDLRNQLEKRGATFHTQSDTEVILQIYLMDGVSGFSKLRGMYAFALWDEFKKVGLLVRDNYGIKPIFYRQSSNGSLEFASEAKAIFARNKEKAVLDETSVHKVMNFRYLPDNSSMFRDVLQLAPGRVLEWRNGTCKVLEQINEPTFTDTPTITGAIHDSVRCHLTSDVEIGCYLSGGIDSAIVTAIAQKYSNNRLKTFTLNIGDDPLEAINASRTAEILDVENLQLNSQVDVNEYLKRLIYNLEVPKINSLQSGILAQHASKYLKVNLSGLGGDELFLGYNIHKWIANLDIKNSFLKKFASFSGNIAHHAFRYVDQGFWSEKERALLIGKNLHHHSTVYGLLRNIWDSPSARNKLYGPRMLDHVLPDQFLWLHDNWPKDQDPVIATRNFEWQTKMVNDLLWQEDRCSMTHGLEVRVPFVDPYVKQAVWQKGRTEIMQNGITKGLLKEQVKEILPEEIIKRKKSGFQVHSPTFFHNNLLSLSKEYLSKEKVNEHGLFNYEFIKETLKYPQKNKYRWHYFILYLMLSTHILVEKFENEKNA